MLAVPLRCSLKALPRFQYRRVISRAPDELQPHRQILFRKTAGHGKRRQSAEVSNRSEWVGKGKPLGQIHCQRCCRGGQPANFWTGWTD